jgi:serine/threonine protein kinase
MQIISAFQVPTGKHYACKIFNKKLMAGREYLVLNEIQVLKNVSSGHPNLIQLIDYFESPNNCTYSPINLF